MSLDKWIGISLFCLLIYFLLYPRDIIKQEYFEEEFLWDEVKNGSNKCHASKEDEGGTHTKSPGKEWKGRKEGWENWLDFSPVVC